MVAALLYLTMHQKDRNLSSPVPSFSGIRVTLLDEEYIGKNEFSFT